MIPLTSHIKVSQLRALVAVADCGNFGEAALNLGVSQSAVSHAIATLEDHLGVIVFLRGRHGARLTSVGDQIVTYARQALRSLDEISRAAELSRGLQGGHVRIASFRSVATHILPEVIAEFRQQYPAIAIQIGEYRDSGDLEQALRVGQADIGFTLLPPCTDDFETWELLHDEYLALFPPSFKLQGYHLEWEQLSTYPLIGYPEHFRCWKWVEDHCRTCGKTLNVVYRVQEESTVLSMVAQGLGGALLPALAAKPIPPMIKAYPVPGRLFRTIGVATLVNALHPPAVFAFLDVLKQIHQTPTPIQKLA